MFWERYCALCAEKDLSPTAAGLALGVSAESVKRWRRGTTPRGLVLDKVAAFFGCSTDYLLGRTADRNPPGQPETKKAPTPEGAGESPELQKIVAIMATMTVDELLQLRGSALTILSQRPREGA